MIVFTVGDIVALACLVIASLFLLGCYLLDKFNKWKKMRRK